MLAVSHVPNGVLDLCTNDDRVRRLRDPDLARRANLLPERQRDLVHLVLSGNCTFRQLAALTGENPGTICRRFGRLVRRLRDPVVIALIDDPEELSELYRNVGLARFLHGRSIASLAGEHARPAYEIRAILAYLKTWAAMRKLRRLRAESECVSDR